MTRLDPQQIALGIQQPWIELILRGIKTIELRNMSTRQRGRIYLYASRRPSKHPAAPQAIEQHGLSLDELPAGVLVGSVEIVDVVRALPEHAEAACVAASLLTKTYGWVLARPERFKVPVAIEYLPYGVWFYPFQRKSKAKARKKRG